MNRIDQRPADQRAEPRQGRRSIGRPRLPLLTVAALAGALALAGSAIAGDLEPPGPPAPTMKPLDVVEPRIPISSLPFYATQSGSYYLTKSLSGSEGVYLLATRVTLDLNGFSLTGPGGATIANGIQAWGAYDVVVRNGFVSGWKDGVNIGGGDARIEGITAFSNGGNGFYFSSRGEIVSCSARANAASGIVVENSNVRVLRSEARENGAGIGIEIRSGTTGVIDECLVTGNGIGVRLGRDWTIRRSAVSFSNSSGIEVGEGDLVVENTVFGNSAVGILLMVGGGNRVEGNNIVSNAQWGIRCMVGGNLFVRNSARGNVDGNYIIGPGNVAPIEVGTVSNLASNVSY